jgi:serine/threonine protein kinase
MAALAADRNLLFGLLALQNGLIDQVQLVAAFQAWTRDKARALADHLLALGHLNDAQRAVVEAMAELHVAKHGDVEHSLAAIPAGRSTRESLAQLADPDIEGSLAQVGSVSTQHDGEADPFRTLTHSFGTVTSGGPRFRVLRPHAQGGLGAVFVALDSELHREVALKQILDRHADDPHSRQRFLLEAEITGGLEHPGIVPVYGLGTYADGRPFYAMRFIKGGSLKEAIGRFHADATLAKDPGRRSLELRKLLRRFTDVCTAIDDAHSRGVLHRDLKPGNIIVGKHGETLVVDWGLAKVVGRVEPGMGSGERTLVPSSASGSAQTLPGSALGTPAYMSPEQAEGHLERLGPRSDVYSLGATLYCLLTGQPPFAGDAVEVIPAVQKGEFPPPRAIDASLDRVLEAVCLKAMALRPADRYGSCPCSIIGMAKKPQPTRRTPARATDQVPDSAALLAELRGLIESARASVAQAVSSTQVVLHWRVGQRILSEILKHKRAAYGDQIVATVSRQLTADYGRGFAEKSLRRMIQFADMFPDPENVAALSRQLSWSHFIEIIPLKTDLHCEFYAEMCRVERWSVRPLRDKISGMLFEWTARSRKPEELARQELEHPDPRHGAAVGGAGQQLSGPPDPPVLRLGRQDLSPIHAGGLELVRPHVMAE